MVAQLMPCMVNKIDDTCARRTPMTSVWCPANERQEDVRHALGSRDVQGDPARLADREHRVLAVHRLARQGRLRLYQPARARAANPAATPRAHRDVGALEWTV